MTLTLQLSDEQTTALEAKAAAEGLSVEAWIILDSMKDIPPEIIATMPTDGASQHDHCIYGWPKRDG